MSTKIKPGNLVRLRSMEQVKVAWRNRWPLRKCCRVSHMPTKKEWKKSGVKSCELMYDVQLRNGNILMYLGYHQKMYFDTAHIMPRFCHYHFFLLGKEYIMASDENKSPNSASTVDNFFEKTPIPWRR